VLIRTDRVGDLVLSTPAIASFRRSWPKAKIIAVVTGYTEPVLRHNPDVDEIVLLPHRSPLAAITQVARLGRQADIAVGLAPRTDEQSVGTTRVDRLVSIGSGSRVGRPPSGKPGPP